MIVAILNYLWVRGLLETSNTMRFVIYVVVSFDTIVEDNGTSKAQKVTFVSL